MGERWCELRGWVCREEWWTLQSPGQGGLSQCLPTPTPTPFSLVPQESEAWLRSICLVAGMAGV